VVDDVAVAERQLDLASIPSQRFEVAEREDLREVSAVAVGARPSLQGKVVVIGTLRPPSRRRSIRWSKFERRLQSFSVVLRLFVSDLLPLFDSSRELEERLLEESVLVLMQEVSFPLAQ
jgi:hypothetical protein